MGISGSCFDKHYDLVIFGAGYSGFAAARLASEAGQSALLVDTRGDVLWESGRAFQFEAEPDGGRFAAFLRNVGRADGYRRGYLDGAITEVLANESLRQDRFEALYYAAPVAAGISGSLIESVAVATKSGIRCLTGSQWIDATENGALVRMTGGNCRFRKPDTLVASLFLHQTHWPDSVPVDLTSAEMPDIQISWLEGIWKNERILRIEMPGEVESFRNTYPEALRIVRSELNT
jgi:hypothetical protein